MQTNTGTSSTGCGSLSSTRTSPENVKALSKKREKRRQHRLRKMKRRMVEHGCSKTSRIQTRQKVIGRR